MFDRTGFDLPALNSSLAGSIFAGKLNFVPITGSTNSDAMNAAHSGAPHGSVFFADEQQAGRGRGDHGWHSASGEGLYVSVLLRPRFPAARLPLLPLAAGLAASDAIFAAAGIAADLRWPNDLLIGPRKAGGILVEAKTESENGESRIAHAVVGIGINVHQRAFSPDLATLATSLDLETGRRISRQSLLLALLKSLERETLGLLDPAATEAIPRRLNETSTWICGRRVEVHGPQACTGITAGLDPSGFLQVQTVSGLVTVQTGGIRALEAESKN
jgi:BirA family biotin operon repressor/biotin-[acetyl-CoA-carboxylase] ligase